MANIKNTTKSDIRVHTEAGDFVFKAGENLELADDRAAMVADKGVVYFTVGELVSDTEIAEENPTKANASIAEDAIKEVAEEVTEDAKPVPAAVKTAVKTAQTAKK